MSYRLNDELSSHEQCPLPDQKINQTNICKSVRRKSSHSGHSSMVQWLVVAIIFAVPAYRQFRAMKDKVEKAAEAAIEVIDKVAEETEKIADEVADAFPGNEMLKQAASKNKAVADEVEEDADKAEALIEKVDEIKEKIDSIVDPVIDKVVKE